MPEPLSPSDTDTSTMERRDLVRLSKAMIIGGLALFLVAVVGEVLGWWNDLGLVLSTAGLLVSLGGLLVGLATLFLDKGHEVATLAATAVGGVAHLHGKQDAMLENQDAMLDNQDAMLDKQDRTVDALDRIQRLLDERLPRST